MQKILTKYGLAAHLAFLAVAPLFLSSTAVLCLTGLAAIWALMEPSRFGDEGLRDARWRVTHTVLRDPLFWVAILLVVLEILRWANGGIARRYDAETGVWSLTEATCSFLPASVGEAADVSVSCAFALLVIVISCRHALGKSARMAYCLLSTFCAGGVATFWIVQLATRQPDALARAGLSLQAPDGLGLVFGCQMIVGLVALVAALERKWRGSVLLLVFLEGLTAAGFILFSTTVCQIALLAVFVVVALYSFFYSRSYLPSSGAFKFIALLGVALTIAVVAILYSLPAKMFDARMADWTSGAIFAKGYWELRAVLDGLSLSIWKSHAWLGGGLGSFALNLQFIATEADWKVIPVGQVVPLNAYWYLLAEQGIVGALIIACPLGFLLYSYVRRLVCGVKAKRLPHPVAWVGFFLLAAVLTVSVWDVSALSSWLLLQVLPLLAISANSFPKESHNV